MLEWKCIGQYFNEETDPNNIFNNKSLMILDGLGTFSFGEFLQAESSSYITYKINSNIIASSTLPSKITFKIRLKEYGKLKELIQFVDCIFIKYGLANEAYYPCFLCSNIANDSYIPFTNKLISKEWCDVELIWVDGICSLIIDGINILSTSSSNIITDDEKIITLRDDDFKINFDICDLNFYTYVKNGYQKPLIKITKTDLDNSVKLSVKTLNHIESPNSVKINGFAVDKNSFFRIIFSDLKQGFKLLNNITIDGCTFSRDVIISYFTECNKIYIDKETGKEILLKLYVSPNVDHNENNDELLSNVFNYYKNIDPNDIFVAEIEMVQNNVNLCGRYITWDYKNSIDALITTHIVKKLQQGEMMEGEPADLSIIITVKKDKNSIYPILFGINFDGLEYKSKTIKNENTITNVFKIVNSDEEVTAENTLSLLSLKDDKITLTCTNQNNASLWNYKNYRRRINTGFVHKLSFLNGIKGAFDPILNMITNLNDIASLINFNMHFESIYESSIESIEVKLIANYEGVNYTVNTCNYINNTIDVFYEKEFYVNFMNSTITELNE